MISVQAFLAILGGIILLGFVGNFFFRITRVPTVVILMLCGMLLRPAIGLDDQATLYRVAPYFGTVALILILFEGGLELDVQGVLKEFKLAFLLGLSYFALCAGGVFVFLHFGRGMSANQGLCYALILAGSSPGILIPTLSQLSIGKKLRTFLTIETTVTELLTVVGTVLFLDMSASSHGAVAVSGLPGHLFLVLLPPVILGGLAGLLWTRFLAEFVREKLAYMLTLSFLFLLYSLTEAVGGKGALAVLFFGLFLGDAPWLVSKAAPWLKRWTGPSINQEAFTVDEVLTRMNTELSFLVRSFFFAYLGMMIDPTSFSGAALLIVGAMVAIFFLCRWAVSILFSRVSSTLGGSHPSVTMAMLPRGLANAVVAFAALQQGALDDAGFIQVVLGTILLTNLVMTVLIFYSESKGISANAAG
jgi:cell volume regulation protein A